MSERFSQMAARSIRVALAATAIVAALYLVAAGAIAVIVHQYQVHQIDGQLAGTLRDVTLRHEDDGGAPPGGYGMPRSVPGEHPYGPPQLVFTVSTNGTVACSEPGAHLPDEDRALTGPQTITVGTTTMRAVGGQVGEDHLVVAQSMEQVNDTTTSLILAEAIVGPLLLGVVFLGALTIGRRVAAPIEIARQRQLAFTADASHELRTPLSVIEATTSLALHGDRSTDWYRRAFHGVHRESDRMRRLVEDLLWLARFDSTQPQVRPQSVDLAVLAEEAAQRFQSRAEAKHLALRYQEPARPATLTVPPEWIDRLLGVLLDNACKYAPERGSVLIRVGVEGRRLEVSVEDSGPGIAPDERAHVFERFHRATNELPGAGLGLAIADAVVRATGGRWQVGRSPLGGAAMSVSWPAG